MRSFGVFAVSATAVLLPAFAVAAPAQPAASTNMQPASTDAQALSPTAPQPAQTATAMPAQSTTASGDDDLNEVVCKDMPARTGSRIGGGRECHSQREWKRARFEARDFTRLQRRMKFNAP